MAGCVHERMNSLIVKFSMTSSFFIVRFFISNVCFDFIVFLLSLLLLLMSCYDMVWYRYCECFVGMKYCGDTCRCRDCYNNLDHDSQRKEAIRITKTRNGTAFQAKVSPAVCCQLFKCIFQFIL